MAEPQDVFRGYLAHNVQKYLQAIAKPLTCYTHPAQEHKRSLLESYSSVTFPLHALGRAAGLSVAPQAVVIRASGGRKGRFL